MGGVVMRLPWSTGEYHQLESSDLNGSPPTPEERIRVVAAMATASRDFNIRNVSTGGRPPFNAEAMRVVLTIDDAGWQKIVPELREALAGLGYDTAEGLKRFNQVSESSL
jgi:hypothetical protein